MFHSIISDYDVFFAGNNEYTKSQNTGDIYPMANYGGVPQRKNFFSTDPKDYLRAAASENKSVF